MSSLTRGDTAVIPTQLQVVAACDATGVPLRLLAQVGAAAFGLHQGRAAGPLHSETIYLDLATVPAEVDRVHLLVSPEGDPAGVRAPMLLVYDNGAPSLVIELPELASAQAASYAVAELYRSGEGWAIHVLLRPEQPAPAAGPAGQSVAGPAGQTTAAPVSLHKTLDQGPVSLSKGERVELTKGGVSVLTRVSMCLGWDPAAGHENIDLDASVIAFDGNAKKLKTVWFLRQSAFKDAIKHSGDNLTGDGDGDDEIITVDLTALPNSVYALVFTINSFSGQKFTEVANAFCRLVDGPDGQGTEVVRFNLSKSEPETGVLMAVVRRTTPGAWEMQAIGEFHKGGTVRKMVAPAALRVIG